MTHYAYIALIFALLGFVKWYSVQQYDSGLNACKAAYAVKLEEAVASTKETEKSRYTLVSQAIQEQFDEVSTINSNLIDDLAKLRDRPERTEPSGLSGEATVKCETANGAELDRINAGFLVRYGAKAAEQDAALASCYFAYDSLSD